MDSGSSGSLQSSSGGGDDEFDSRGGGGVDSSPLSALLRPAPSSSIHGCLYGLQDFATAQQQQTHRAGFWSGASESLTGAAGASSSSSPRVSGADQGARQQAETSAAAQGSAPPRGSRKRTRASRRAPTTVLTTDTSNFRAMVQEFTGIPSPPFAAGVGPPATAFRARLGHVFPPPSSLRSAAADAASLPPYLLRPFAQKIPSAPSAFPPFTSSSSSSTLPSGISAVSANATTRPATTAGASSNPTAETAAASGATDTFQLSSFTLLRPQDPSTYLSFQNLLDSQSSSQSIFGATGVFAQAPRLHQPPGPSPSEFLAYSGSGNLGLAHGGLMVSPEGLHLHPRSDARHGDDELSGVVASGSSCKPNYSTHAGMATSSSAAASGEEQQDTGAAGTARSARGEGLDPWICTSE